MVLNVKVQIVFYLGTILNYSNFIEMTIFISFIWKEYFLLFVLMISIFFWCPVFV